MNFKKGDTCYIVANGSMIKQGLIKQIQGGFYMIVFESGGIIRLKQHRLFATEEEAQASIPLHRRKRRPNVYDYEH